MTLINVRAVLGNSLSIVLLMVVSSQPVSAEWLIGYDGSRLETRGPWKVQGSRIVLTLPNGRLASIAVDEIDLEQSRLESSPTRARPAEDPTPRRQPSIVWTNRSLPVAESVRSVEEQSDPRSFELSGTSVRVEFWVALKDARSGGIEIQGRVRNSSETAVRVSEARAEIVDPVAGNLNEPIALRDPLLGPGEVTSFRGRFPGLSEEHADPKFTVITEAISQID